VNDVLALKQFVRRKMNETRGLPDTLTGGNGADAARGESAMNGTLENAKGAALYKLCFHHDYRAPYFFCAFFFF
jgi:hypothetical protein